MYVSDNKHVVWLSKDVAFPHPNNALGEGAPFSGLLAAGGDLTPKHLVAAYQRGIFPWSEAYYPLLWWCPHPRMVLYPEQFKISKSLRKSIIKLLNAYSITINTNFAEVIQTCAHHRERTWITAEMQQAYTALHHLQLAHSFELRQEGKLYAALYGVCLGEVFFGESMMTHVTDGSKVLLWALCQFARYRRITMIDCQVESAHLMSLGACNIPRQSFLQHLNASVYKRQQRRWDFSAIPLLP